MSLYGIEAEADCRKEIDELLAMVDFAEEALKIASTTAKRAMEVLKSRLKTSFAADVSSRGLMPERTSFLSGGRGMIPVYVINSLR